jgi:hypothetical protein
MKRALSITLIAIVLMGVMAVSVIVAWGQAQVSLYGEMAKVCHGLSDQEARVYCVLSIAETIEPCRGSGI